jgi:hypothetical protein
LTLGAVTSFLSTPSKFSTTACEQSRFAISWMPPRPRTVLLWNLLLEPLVQLKLSSTLKSGRQTPPDRLKWLPKEAFSCHSVWDTIRSRGQKPKNYDFVWVKKAFPASSDHLLTQERLRKLGHQFPSRCELCASASEDSAHLVSAWLWVSTTNLFGVKWHPTSNLILDIQTWFKTKFQERTVRWSWERSFQTIIWVIWKLRNSQIFGLV